MENFFALLAVVNRSVVGRISPRTISCAWLLCRYFRRISRLARSTEAASLAAIVKEKPQTVVVDLSNVTYIDSSGLAILIEGMQNVEAYGGKFALAGLQEVVRPIFEIARLDQEFRLFPDVEAALAA